MQKFFRIYLFINALSVDIALGAWLNLKAASLMSSVRPSYFFEALICIGCWQVYTLDHLLDAASIKNPVTLRHLLHKKYSIYIIIILTLSFFVTAFLIAAAFSEIHYTGWIIAFAIVAYLLLAKNFYFPKETIASFLFALAIWFLPLEGTNDPVRAATGFMFFFFAAFLNIVTFSIYEWDSDIKQNQLSLFGRLSISNFLFCMIFMVAMLLLFVFMNEFYAIENSYFLFLFIVPLLLFVFPNTFHKGKLYRIIGDVSFIIAPLLLIYFY